jgi:hypothetical protein
MEETSVWVNDYTLRAIRGAVKGYFSQFSDKRGFSPAARFMPASVSTGRLSKGNNPSEFGEPAAAGMAAGPPAPARRSAAKIADGMAIDFTARYARFEPPERSIVCALTAFA